MQGFNAKSAANEDLPSRQSSRAKRSANGGTSGFDGETLGGQVTYEAPIGRMPYLGGQLEGLIVRYPV